MKFAAVDIETTGLTWKDSILTVGAAWDAPEGLQSKAWSLGMTDLFTAPYSVPEFIQELSDIFRGADVISMHNTVFDLSFLMGYGYVRVEDVQGKLFDTLLSGRMTGARESLSLENLCKQYKIGDSAWGRFKGKRNSLSSMDVESVLNYNREDAVNTLLLAKELWREAIAIYDRDFIFRESDFCRLMAQVRVRGKQMNLPATIRYWRQLVDRKRSILQGVLYPNQMQGPNDRTGIIKFLRRQGWEDKDFKYTEKGNETFTEDALEKMMVRAKGNVREVFENIIELRHIEKKLTTYIVPFIEEHADEDGRIHHSYTVGGTTTYRLSSQNPNGQNIPRDMGPILWGSYLSADYSQAELRLAAIYARETAMANAFHEELDVHMETARAMFGKEDKESRQLAKSVNFSCLYGGGARALEPFGISNEDALKFIRRHREVYPNFHKFTRIAQDTWQKKGYLRLLSGKRIYATKDDLQRPYKAFNNIIQGGVGELVKNAMMELDRRGAVIIGQIHDSIEFEMGTMENEEILDVMENILPEELARRNNPPVKMKCDIEIKGSPVEEENHNRTKEMQHG